MEKKKEIIIRHEGEGCSVTASEPMLNGEVFGTLIAVTGTILANCVRKDVSTEKFEEAAQEGGELVRELVVRAIKAQLEERGRTQTGPLSVKERDFLRELMRGGQK